MAPPPILRPGSKGKLVTLLQKFLNLKGKLPNPVPEDGEYGVETRDAVRFFQKKNGITVDGTVGPETAGALAKLVGPSAAAFGKAFGEVADADADAKPGAKPGADKKDEKAGTKPEEKVYTLAVKGKTYVFNEKEFAEFNKLMLAELRRTAVVGAMQRTVAARTIWDHFNDLNKDQYIISWFVGLGGPKLPDESLVKNAERAHDALKSAVDGGDFRNVAKALKDVQEPVNTAYAKLMEYQEAVIGRSGTWIAGLEFTRDTSADIVTLIATAELGGHPGAGAVAGGAVELVKSASGELGKCLAGTSGGAGEAAKNIVVDGVLGAATGAASALLKVKGDAIIKGVAESAAKKMAGRWLGRLGTTAVTNFLAKRLEGAGKGALEAAIKNASKLIKGDTTPAQFFEEVAKGLGWGALLGGLDSWISSKFGETVYNKMSPAFRTKFFGKLKPKDAIDLLGELIPVKASGALQKSLEVAFAKAKGSESADELGLAAATEFANTGVKSLEAEIAKRVKE